MNDHDFVDADNFGEPRCDLCGETKMMHYATGGPVTPEMIERLQAQELAYRCAVAGLVASDPEKERE